MYCRDGHQCLLRALTATNVRNIPCDKVQKSLDILAENVVDCRARAAIYNCVKTNVPYVSTIHVLLSFAVVSLEGVDRSPSSRGDIEGVIPE